MFLCDVFAVNKDTARAIAILNFPDDSLCLVTRKPRQIKPHLLAIVNKATDGFNLIRSHGHVVLLIHDFSIQDKP